MANKTSPINTEEETLESYLTNLKQRVKRLHSQHDDVIDNYMLIINEMSHIFQPAAKAEDENIPKIQQLICKFELANEKNTNEICMPLGMSKFKDAFVNMEQPDYEQILNHQLLFKESLELCERAKESFQKIDDIISNIKEPELSTQCSTEKFDEFEQMNNRKQTAGSAIESSNDAFNYDIDIHELSPQTNVGENNELEKHMPHAIKQHTPSSICNFDELEQRRSPSRGFKSKPELQSAIFNKNFNNTTTTKANTPVGATSNAVSPSSARLRAKINNLDTKILNESEVAAGVSLPNRFVSNDSEFENSSCYASCCSSGVSLDIFHSIQEISDSKHELTHSKEKITEDDSDNDFDFLTVYTKILKK